MDIVKNIDKDHFGVRLRMHPNDFLIYEYFLKIINAEKIKNTNNYKIESKYLEDLENFWKKNGDLKYIFATGHNLRIFNSSKEFVDQLEKDKIEKKKAIENLYAHLNRPDKSFKTLKYLLCNKF